jgi:hypothetical protein
LALIFCLYFCFEFLHGHAVIWPCTGHPTLARVMVDPAAARDRLLRAQMPFASEHSQCFNMDVD